MDGAKFEKTAFLSHLYIKTNILPSQARDKHRENSKKMPFSQVRRPAAAADRGEQEGPERGRAAGTKAA
jgi:hypothetical protein